MKSLHHMVYGLLACSLITVVTPLPRAFLSSGVVAGTRKRFEHSSSSVHSNTFKLPTRSKHRGLQLPVLHAQGKQYPQAPTGLRTEKSDAEVAHPTNVKKADAEVAHPTNVEDIRWVRSKKSDAEVSRPTNVEDAAAASYAHHRTVSHDVSSSHYFLYCVFFGILLGALILTICFASDALETSRLRSESDQGAAAKVAENQQSTVKALDKAKGEEPNIQESDVPPIRVANTRANILMLESDEDAQGTWVKTFRKADMHSREALELLFRCNIIPMDEFANSFVSQEHIDECVWISTQMLRQRSLQEWVDMWPQATKTFEESVTACFAARTDVLANLYGGSEPGTPGSTERDLSIMGMQPPGYRTSSHSPMGPSPIGTSQTVRENSPASDRGLMDCRTPGVSPGAAQIPHQGRSNAGASSHQPVQVGQTFTRSNVPSSTNLSEVSFSGPQGAPRRSAYGIRSDNSLSPPVTQPHLHQAFSDSSATPPGVQLGRTPPSGPTPPTTGEFRSVPPSVVSRCRELMDDTPAHNRQWNSQR